MTQSGPDLWDLTMAFQPIVDLRTQKIFAYEALVRHADGSSAQDVLPSLTPEMRTDFDNLCRGAAIRLADAFDIKRVSINTLPGSLMAANHGLERMCEAADRHEFDEGNVIAELSEGAALAHRDRLARVFEAYRLSGFRLAIDNFGIAGGAVQLLAELKPDFVKLHKSLCAASSKGQDAAAVIRGIVKVAQDLNISVIAEGVETGEVALRMRDLGVTLQQGYFYAKGQLGRAIQDHEISYDFLGSSSNQDAELAMA